MTIKILFIYYICSLPMLQRILKVQVMNTSVHRLVITHTRTLALAHTITVNYLPFIPKHRGTNWWQRSSPSLNTNESVLIYNLICRMRDKCGLKGKLHISVFLFRIPRMDWALPSPIPPGFASVSSVCTCPPSPAPLLTLTSFIPF